jgi:type II secretory pathway pseudopilin PulG
MMRRTRGYALLAVMIAIAAVLTLGAVVSSRVESGIAGRELADRRVQALWLARSAVRTQLPASHDVPLGRGVTARVRVFGFGSGRFAADVVVPGRGSARVDATFAADGRLTALTESWRAQ